MFCGSSDVPKMLDAIRCGLLEEETSSVLPKRLLEPPPGAFNTLQCRGEEQEMVCLTFTASNIFDGPSSFSLECCE